MKPKKNKNALIPLGLAVVLVTAITKIPFPTAPKFKDSISITDRETIEKPPRSNEFAEQEQIFREIIQKNTLKETEEKKRRRKIQERYWQIIDNKRDREKKTAPELSNRLVYTWKDEKGTVHISNTDYPENNQNLKIIQQTPKTGRTTPILIQSNNSILVPVVIGHKGRILKTNFLLDTGCSGTLFHHTIVEKIGPKITGNTRSIVADGRTVHGISCEVDSIQVGPHTVRNFQATTYHVQRRKNYEGLLGMGFLKDHPFQIDLKNKVIRWL